MPASYPSSAKTFTTKSDGPGNTILAAHINDLQLEVTAIEQDLIAGLPVARGGTGATSLTANRVPHVNGAGTALTSTAGLTFDGTTLTAPATTITGTLTPQALLDASGAAAGQIKFPATQNASTNANTLDDYEEGTWTPVIGGSGGTSGQSYTTQVGKYVKVGKLVTAYFNVVLSNKGTISNNAQIQGLPFTSENTTDLIATLVIGKYANLDAGSGQVWLGGSMEPNATVATLVGTSSATATSAVFPTSGIANTTQLVGAITYAATA